MFELKQVNVKSSTYWENFGAGIYRDVTLLKLDRCRIKEDSIQLTTLEADQELAVLMLRGRIANAGDLWRKGIPASEAL